MKIIWHSVAPWAPTGYGQQTAVNVPRIKALGHDIALSCYYGLQGSRFDWQGITCYPSYNAPYGTDVLVPNALDWFGAADDRSLADASCRGMIITLGDVWTFESPLLDQMAVASWVPVDHLQVPDAVRTWFEAFGAVPIAMSRFGEQALTDAGLHPVYVPHSVDTSIFRPGDKAAARSAAGIPEDVFVIGMVANNVGRDGNRKAFAEQITAFAQFHASHPDSMLALHTDVDSSAGMKLRAFLARMLPKGAYTYTDVYSYRKGLTPAAVAEVHRSFDVLSNCSYGEGFGVPVVESQAVGNPVIVTDATAMSELCGAGWKVGYEPTWHDSQGGWAAVPRIGEIADAYGEAYEKARDENMRARAWAFAQAYDADTVADACWQPVLGKFEDGLARRKADIAARRTLLGRARRTEKIRESDGLYWIDRGEGTDDWVAYTDHENWIWPILAGLLPEDGVLLDVGAHVGRWSLRLAARASHVYAVEANPSACATLRRHLAMNAVTNVTVIEAAAWDDEAMLTLEDPNGRLDGGGTRTLPAPGGTVRAARLDSLITGLDRLDLIKLDVEGADLHALRGMSGLLMKHRPVLLIECHDLYGYYTRADLESTLTTLGYGFEVAASVGSNWQPGIGVVDEVRPADYLVARPAKVSAPA